jgi:agmatinase
LKETLPFRFLGLPDRFAEYDTSRFVVLPIPYDATTSFQVGTRNGPAGVIEASRQLEWFDEELEREVHRPGIHTMHPLEPEVSGPAAMHERIYKYARKAVRDGKFLIGLGGEHSVTGGLVRAVAGKHKKLSILQIDAHLDLRDIYQESPYSHASVMRRCMDWVDRIVPVGIRNISMEEHKFLKTSPIQPIMARDCYMSDDWAERALEGLGENVYMTIDIDGFDPAYAPGTGTPEPGGLDWYQVTSLLQLVAGERRIVAADVVEVMPIPGQAVTEFLAARLIYKLIGYVGGV